MTSTLDDWRPTASRARLERRAAAFAQVRAFFAKRGVVEVDTPIVVNAPVTDVHIHSAEVRFPDDERTTASATGGQPPAHFFLHTSPEFAMKRLLAAGSGDIYQICHVARGLERGRRHNAEFTLIEWYRNGFTLEQLMHEVDSLARAVLGPMAAPFASQYLTYREAFVDALGLDPLAAPLAELQSAALDLGFTLPSANATSARDSAPNALDLGFALPSTSAGSSAHAAPHAQRANLADSSRDELLDFLMAAHIGPRLGRKALTFIHRYPASQAALARLDTADPRTALRFELYCEGIELANGFHELAAATEQRARFEQDLAERRRRGLPTHGLDERLLAALAHGLPDCAGVALGFDRLLMLATGATHIDEVLPFPTDRA